MMYYKVNLSFYFWEKGTVEEMCTRGPQEDMDIVSPSVIVHGVFSSTTKPDTKQRSFSRGAMRR